MDRHHDIHRNLEQGGKGHFILENNEGQAVLTVHPPARGGTSVRYTDVLARLELFGIEGFDPEEVREIVENADGTPYPLCEWQEPDPIDAKVVVEISEDEMEAWIETTPAKFGGKTFSEEDLIQILKEHGVVRGILRNHLSEAITARNSHRVSAAMGTGPRNGKSGKIIHFFYDPPGPLALKEEGGRVDFKKISVIRSAKKGETLAEISDPEPGEVGNTVTGKEVAAQRPEVAELIAGKNTILSEDKKSIVAAITGQVRIQREDPYRKALFEMDEVLDLETVDYSTGHIDFPGSIIIRGRVADGFRVKSGGDIQVEKSVGTVRLEAGGNILLSGGIVSRGGGYISAGGSIYARFVESAALNAGESIFIEEAVMHSRLTAGSRIVVEGGRGEIMGGVMVTGKELLARKIGARVGTPTRINAGLDPRTLDQLRLLDSEYEDRLTTLGKVETHIGQLEESRRRGRELSLEEDENLEKLRVIREKLRSHLENLEIQREKVYNLIQPDPDATVIATEIVYPGVEISFGAGVRKYSIEGRPIDRYSRFVLEHSAIVLRHSDL